eukprot:gene8965-9895_t
MINWWLSGIILALVLNHSCSRLHHSSHLLGEDQQESAAVPFNGLPLLPLQLPPAAGTEAGGGGGGGEGRESKETAPYHKHIPRRLWIAVKHRDDPLPPHLKELFDRNPGWEVTICDNLCKDSFMTNQFANTSVSAIYHLINPLVGAARADVWRYAVLYTYGGVYLDDDSDIKVPLDDVIEEQDRLILSEEGSSSLGECYIPSYHLADSFTFQHFLQPLLSQNRTVTAPHYDGLKESKVPIFFHDHTLVNWGMFAAPRHPLFRETLKNIVEILTTEYLRQSVVHMTRWDVKWKQVMCSTGFVLTYTLREMELKGESLTSAEVPRILTNNFKQYKGNVKAFWTGGDSTHYMKAMQRKNGPHILREFAPINLRQIVSFLDGRAVMGDAGKAIYLVKDGKKYTFGSYDTFQQMGFTDRSTRHVPDHILLQIPDGGDASTAPTTPSQTSQYKDSSPSSPSHGVGVKLTKISQVLATRNQTQCFGDDYDGTRDDFLQDRYKDSLDGLAVMVHPLCLTTFQLGNTLGYFLNDIACASITGAHFLALRTRLTLTLVNSLQVQDSAQQKAFFDHLPHHIIHPQPLGIEEVKKGMRAKCHCLQFCWENSEAPWLQRVPLIRDVLMPAIDAYRKVSRGEEVGTVLNNETDRLYLPPTLQSTLSLDYKSNNNYHITPRLSQVWLPLVPNVTIQYRCGDNIGFGKTKYGLLPFSVYSPKRLGNPSFIYVIADSPKRNPSSVYSGRCEPILDRFLAYLVRHYPSSVIALKRGGDIFLDYARLAYSNVVFCSASTFCLWPGLSNDRGQVYYPLTPLIAKAATNETAPNLKHNFHWIGEVEMIKQFKHYRPWTKLIDDLETLGS